MKYHRILKISIALLLVTIGQSWAQVNEVYSEAPFRFENGIVYSDRVTVNFRENVIPTVSGEISLTLDRVNSGYGGVVSALQNLSARYGGITLIKQIPRLVWGDVARIHKRTSETVIVKDLSQLFSIKFNQVAHVE